MIQNTEIEHNIGSKSIIDINVINFMICQNDWVIFLTLPIWYWLYSKPLVTGLSHYIAIRLCIYISILHRFEIVMKSRSIPQISNPKSCWCVWGQILYSCGFIDLNAYDWTPRVVYEWTKGDTNLDFKFYAKLVWNSQSLVEVYGGVACIHSNSFAEAFLAISHVCRRRWRLITVATPR